MTAETQLLIVAGIVVLALGLFLILKFGQAMTRLLIILTVLVVAGLVAWALGAQANATHEVAQVAQVAQVQAMTGVATALTLTLLLLLVSLLGFTGLLIAGWLWWKERQRRQRLLEFLWNQVYGTSGVRSGLALPVHLPVQGTQGNGPVIVLSTYPPSVPPSGEYWSSPAQWQEPNLLEGLLPE